MKVDTWKARTHRSLNKFPHRHSNAVATRVARVELNLFDGRHRPRNAVVSFLQLREICREHTSVLDVAENEFASECSDPAVVGEPVGDGMSLVVVVHRNGIREPVLLTSVQHLLRQRKQFVELPAAPPAILPIALSLHPAVVLAVADDVDLLD